MIINSYIFSSIDSDAQAFITAANITDSTQKTAINQLVIDIKGYGLWSKMKAVYPFVGGTAASHKWNLTNPLDTDAAFRLIFSGGWVHSNTGAAPNGANAYANTFLSSDQMGLNNTHISFYSTTQFSDQNYKVNIGYLRPTPDSYSDIAIDWNTAAVFRLNNSAIYTATTNGGNTKGFYTVSRTASNIIKGFKNGSIILNASDPSNATANVAFYIGATNNNGTPQYYTPNECIFCSMGDGLSDTEASNLYTAVQNFNTTLNRQIP